MMILHPWVILNMLRSTRIGNGKFVDKKVSYKSIPSNIDGNEKKRVGYGILSIDHGRLTVEFTHLKGVDPTVDDLLVFIFSDKDVRKMIRYYQNTDRTLQYKIDLKDSDDSIATKVFINFYKKGIFYNRKFLFKWSDNKKIHRLEPIYIGDLVEAMVCFRHAKNIPVWWVPCYQLKTFDRKWLRSQTSFRYEKCECEEDAYDYVSTII